MEQPKDREYPMDTEIRTAVLAYVHYFHSDIWPEDDWFLFGDWDVNVWQDDEEYQCRATVYPTEEDETNTNRGVSFLFSNLYP